LSAALVAGRVDRFHHISHQRFDSREVLARWEREKQDWLRRRGIVPGARAADSVADLAPADQRKFHFKFNRCREDFLDTCHGRCVLRQPELARIVADSLLHFDKVRYRMGDFIVMPNHVHLLSVFPSESAMRDMCGSWLRFTATKINRALGTSGSFWQEEPFDHLVRSPEQYEYLRAYIADNPLKARLQAGEYYYRRYPG
jgi:putative transposase